MPDLPTEQETVNPSATPLPPIQDALTPEALGAGVGSALENAGEVATRFHHDQVASFNQSMVLDAHNQLEQGNQKAIYDPQGGVLYRNTGLGAPKAVDDTLADYDKRVAGISQNLANPQQQEQFARMAQDTRYQLQQHLNGYESQQVRGYQDGVTKATIANSLTSAVRNAQLTAGTPDPNLQTGPNRDAAIAKSSNDAMDLGAAAITDKFRRDNPGAPANDPRLVEQLDAYRSEGHYGVIQSLLSTGRDQDASAYYTAHKDQLQGEQADNAARSVEAGSTAGDAMRIAPGLVFDGKGQQKPLADIYGQLNSDPRLQANPKLADATRRQVSILMDQQEAIKRQQDDQGFDKAYDAMKASPQGIADPAVQAQLKTLSFQRQRYLEAAGEKDQELRAQQREIPDNSNAYLGVLNILSSPDPAIRAQGATLDYASLRGQLSPGDFKKVVPMLLRARGEQNAAATGPDGDDGTQGILRANQIMQETLLSNGFTSKRPNGDPDPDWLAFQRAFNEDVAAAGGPKALGADGMQKRADWLMMQHWESKPNAIGAIYGDMTPDHDELAPGRRFQALGRDFRYGPQQMTPQEQSSVTRELQARGIANPSAKQMYDAYRNKYPAAKEWWNNPPIPEAPASP